MVTFECVYNKLKRKQSPSQDSAVLDVLFYSDNFHFPVLLMKISKMPMLLDVYYGYLVFFFSVISAYTKVVVTAENNDPT